MRNFNVHFDFARQVKRDADNTSMASGVSMVRRTDIIGPVAAGAGWMYDLGSSGSHGHTETSEPGANLIPKGRFISRYRWCNSPRSSTAG